MLQPIGPAHAGIGAVAHDPAQRMGWRLDPVAVAVAPISERRNIGERRSNRVCAGEHGRKVLSAACGKAGRIADAGSERRPAWVRPIVKAPLIAQET